MVKPNKSTKAQFEKDLADGEKFEKKVAEMAAKKYAYIGEPVVFPEEKAYYDFSIGHLKFEVKCDKRASDTGNLAFEWEYRDKPSGIARQEPHVWIHGMGEQGCDGILFAQLDGLRTSVLSSFYEGKEGCRDGC